MSIKQVLWLCAMVLINVVLESILIPTVNLFGLRPDSVIPLIVAMSLVSGAAKGSMYGFTVGLILDVYFSSYLGMYAMGYVFWGIVIGLFADRYFAQNLVFPFFAGSIGYLFKEGIVAVQLMMMGTTFVAGDAFWRYFLPSAILTGLISVPVYGFYQQNRRFEMRRSKWDSKTSVYERRAR